MSDMADLREQIHKARLSVVLMSLLVLIGGLAIGAFVMAVGLWLDVPRFAGGLTTGIALTATIWSMRDMVDFELERLGRLTERRDRAERAIELP